MPDLVNSLRNQDLGHLQIVAELWGVELDAPDARTALPVLVEAIRTPELVEEILEALAPAALAALVDMCGSQGRMPWSLFTKRYGVVREMGPGRRDRERPFRAPVSATEILWYRGLIGRAFFDSPTGPEEFVFIPDDLLPILQAAGAVRAFQSRPGSADQNRLGRAAHPDERSHRIPATDRILDDTCTLLAALRLGFAEQDFDAGWPMTWETLRAFVSAAGLLDPQGLPDPEGARQFLEAPRGAALSQLVSSWLASDVFNELRLVPHLLAEGAWENYPRRARATLIQFLQAIPADTWWSLTAFVSAIREAHPDYQRPAGDYDSWFIRDRRTGDYLRGFEAWDAVDGELIRFAITGPLHWLGILDLAAPASEGPITAFRRSKWADALLGGRPPAGLPDEVGTLHIRSDGRLTVPHLAPRSARYQIARFCQWESPRNGEHRYRITPASLERARLHGLRVSQLVNLLRRYAQTVPPNIDQALDRWEKHGAEVRLENVTVLRLRSPDLLQALRASRAARFLGDPLGPTSVVVKGDAGEKVLAILTEMGYLGEIS